jgi:alkylation response protein AidB-like acyl-CoA dehydrogenase
MQLGAVALAAESLGAAQHCFDTALAYTKDRVQFGRPISSFQAIKHICADLLMAVEGSRSAAYYAGWVAAEQREELPAIGPLAKAQVCEAFWDVAKANIQLHGGIGFTYEHEAHYYYRRATSSRVLLGDTSFNREMLLQGLGVAPVGAPN